MTKKILLVEDNHKYATALMEKMKEKEYKVTYFSNPIEAITEFANTYFDVVVTDYHMKEMDGIKLLTILKGLQIEIKTIVLTAYPEEELESKSLDIEVDRFLSKDKSLDLVIKYVDDLIRERIERKERGRIISSSVESIVVDLTKQTVRKEDEIVDIAPKEFQLLELFLSHKGETVTREEIAQHLWSTSVTEIDDKSIDVLIHSLRKKLSLVSLSSIRGVGYRWNE